MKVFPLKMTDKSTEIDREDEVERKKVEDLVTRGDVVVVQVDQNDAVDQVDHRDQAEQDVENSAHLED
mgnify:CR=1 FL=1